MSEHVLQVNVTSFPMLDITHPGKQPCTQLHSMDPLPHDCFEHCPNCAPPWRMTHTRPASQVMFPQSTRWPQGKV
jgi:hypothetical protein